MDKTFEDIIGETLKDLTNDNQLVNNIESDSEGTADSDTSNLEETVIDSEGTADSNAEETNLEETNTDDNVLNESEDLGDNEEVPSVNEKDAQAFARMRTELKQTNDSLNAANNVIEFFDTRAKQAGLSGIQELMQKTIEAEMAKQAEKEGIPVEVVKRINDLENRVKQQDVERENLVKTQKEQALNSVFDKFMQSHSLGQNELNKLASDLVADGFSFDALMNMPDSAVTKILNSYLPNETLKQESLVKKEQIKKEVPPTGNTSSKVDLSSEIDKIAKSWVNNY